jgi:hypothetical protein
LHPGKIDVCVIDIVDNSEAHALAGLNRLFELPDSMDLRGHDVLKTLQRAREIGHRYPWVDVNGVSRAGDLDFVMERVDPPGLHHPKWWSRTPSGPGRPVSDSPFCRKDR